MKLIFGAVFVLCCVLGGFLLHHGKLAALFVPTEYLIISGCLVGGMVIQNPVYVLKRVVTGILGLLAGGGALGKKAYLELLQMMYQLLQLARKEGVLALEEHVNDPKASAIFAQYPTFMKNHHAVDFTCDTLKLFVAGVLDAHSLDELMENDLEVLHHEELEPANALQTAADSLPTAARRRRSRRCRR